MDKSKSSIGNLYASKSIYQKSGRNKSCACCCKPIPTNIVDISNQRFGRLKAVFPTEHRDKKGSVYWHCRCKCGKELEVTEDGLVHGNYRSCGCLKRELQAKINERLTFVDNTCVDWLKNRKSRIDNTSGHRGVYKTTHGSWKASIGLQGKSYYIGTYRSFPEAVRARLKVERLLHDGFVSSYSDWCQRAAADEDWARDNPFYFRASKCEGSFKVETPFGSAGLELK